MASTKDADGQQPAPARRKFFAKTGMVAGGFAAAGALAIPLSGDKVLDAAYPDIKENQVELPANGKSVIVIGGGLAGIQAGVELASRGFKVTVLEKSCTPGGKLKSWRDKHFGPKEDPDNSDPSYPGYVREHGVHAVWGFYHNLREFMGRYGWQLAETPNDISIYNFRDKTSGASEIAPTTWPAPYDRLQLLSGFSSFAFLTAEDKRNLIFVIRRLLSYDCTDKKQTDYLDGITFEAYLKALGYYTPGMVSFFTAFCELGWYEGIDKASALTLAKECQLLGGTPNDLKLQFWRNPVGESFLKPMADYIRAHGGEVHYSTEINGIEVKDKKVTAVRALPVPREAVKRCSICGALILGGQEIGDECPECGAHADMILAIKDSQRAERTFKADYFVCALDTPGLRNLFGKNSAAFGAEPFFQKLAAIGSKFVYVCDMWFDGRGYWETAAVDKHHRPLPTFITTGFESISVMINRSVRIRAIEGKGQWTWSNEYIDKNVTVLEGHMPRAEAVADMPTKEIVDLVYKDFKALIPNLPPPKGWYVNRWRTYTGCHVGEEAKRPAVQSPIDNLLFIGDAVYIPHSCQFMEKTNVTAKVATNLLLDKIGQKEGKITILPSAMQDWAMKTFSAGGSVYLPGQEPGQKQAS